MNLSCLKVAVRAIPLFMVPVVVDAQSADIKSNSGGSFLGVHGGTTLLKAPHINAEPGKGIGVMVGTSVSKRWSIFAGADYTRFRITRDQYNVPVELWSAQPAFARGARTGLANATSSEATQRLTPPDSPRRDVAVSYGYLQGNNSAWHLDAGTQFAFANPQRRLIPYLSAAVTLRNIANRDRETTLFNGALTPGAGVQYFVRPDIALDLNARASFGDTKGMGSESFDDYMSTTTRISLGLRIRPK